MRAAPKTATVVSTAKPNLSERPLIDAPQALEMVRLFKMLANDTRLRILHALERRGELCVGDIARELGSTPQAVSNQLQRFVDRRILHARREGNRLYYRIADPCVTGLLDLGFCLLEETAATSHATGGEARAARRGRRR